MLLAAAGGTALTGCKGNVPDGEIISFSEITDAEDKAVKSQGGDSLDFKSQNIEEQAKGNRESTAGVVNFDRELDGYQPLKKNYNFYFTYKQIHPWWDAVALGIEDAAKAVTVWILKART